MVRSHYRQPYKSSTYASLLLAERRSAPLPLQWASLTLRFVAFLAPGWQSATDPYSTLGSATVASITKRPSGGWQARVRLNGHDTKTKTFTTRAEALAWARATEQTLSTEPPGETEAKQLAGAVLLRQGLLRYQDEITPRKRGARIEHYIIRGLLKDPIADLPIGKITAVDVTAWRNRRLKKVQSGTVLRAWNLLHHLFEVARREWGLAVDNPAHIARRPKPPIPRDRRLREGELEALDAACDATRTPWLKPLIYLAIDTGMRKGEILLMTWSDVNLADGHIFIPAVNTKTSKARTVPLSPRARGYLEGLTPPDLKSGSAGTKYATACKARVFPITPNAAKLSWQRTLKRAHIEDLHFHDLRHEATSRFFEMGLDTMEVAAITGHETLQLKRYTHIKTRRLVDRMAWPDDATRPQKAVSASPAVEKPTGTTV